MLKNQRVIFRIDVFLRVTSDFFYRLNIAGLIIKYKLDAFDAGIRQAEDAISLLPITK